MKQKSQEVIKVLKVKAVLGLKFLEITYGATDNGIDNVVR